MVCIASRFPHAILFPNLMTICGLNLMKRRVAKELEQLKHLSFKIQVTSQNVTTAKKKRKQYQINHIQQLGEFPCKSYP